MRIGLLGRAMIASSLLALVFCVVAASAQDRGQITRQTGLDPDLVQVLRAEVGGAELTLTFVFINDRTFDSKVSSSLRAILRPYVGQNALYVNPSVDEVVSEFPFDPVDVSIETVEGERFRPGLDAWVEITNGFLAGRFDVNPAGADQGSGSEGILVLGDAIDSSEPFALLYRGERVTFDISSTPTAGAASPSRGPAAATESHDPIAVPLLEDVSSLEEVLALPDLTSESISALFALPPDDVRTTEIVFLNDEILRLVYVRLEGPIGESTLGADLIERLEPLIGTGAVMVWAFSPTGVSFSPWNLFVQQSATNYFFFSSTSFVELTTGFIRVEEIAPDEMVAGVIRLPKGTDPDGAYAIFYGSTGVNFP